jgi:hypothetical protein
MKQSSAKNKKSTFQPGRGKTWADKLSPARKPEVKRNDKGFADIPPGCTMLIATPKVVDDYVRNIPKGKSVSLQTMRKDMAAEYSAQYTCPVTAGIFLRIVSEAAYEQHEKGKAIRNITPFWRMVDANSTIGKKLSFGSGFVKKQRAREGLDPKVQTRSKK